CLYAPSPACERVRIGGGVENEIPRERQYKHAVCGSCGKRNSLVRQTGLFTAYSSRGVKRAWAPFRGRNRAFAGSAVSPSTILRDEDGALGSGITLHRK